MHSGSRPTTFSPSVEPERASFRDHPARRRARRRRRRRPRLAGDVGSAATERVSNPMYRADEAWLPRGVLQSPPDLADEDVEVRVHDIGVRPDPGLQLGFLHDARALVDQTPQQVEGLGRQVELGTVAKELPRVRVDGEWAESKSHAAAFAGLARQGSRTYEFLRDSLGLASPAFAIVQGTGRRDEGNPTRFCRASAPTSRVRFSGTSSGGHQS